MRNPLIYENVSVETFPAHNENLCRPRGRRDVSGGATGFRQGRVFGGTRTRLFFGGPQVRALENSASVCPRGPLRVRAVLPSAGDGPPSPWPRRGSRYDLARLYRLRRRVIVDGRQGGSFVRPHSAYIRITRSIALAQTSQNDRGLRLNMMQSTSGR